MGIKKARDLGKGLLRLRSLGHQVLAMGNALALARPRRRLGVYCDGANCIAKEQVARAAGQDRGGKAVEVAVDRRKLRIFQVVPSTYLADDVEGVVIKWDRKSEPCSIPIDDLNKGSQKLKDATKRLRQFLHEIRNFQALRPLGTG